MRDGQNNPKNPFSDIPWWVKSILLFAIVGTLCYKFLTSNFSMAFDFQTFLSLALALFSVFLAALFYFKATDSSNAFYDNTYKFTQQVSELLAKIESGFGERLTHLDHSFRGIRDKFDNMATPSPEETEKEIEETKEIEKGISEDRDKLINELLEKANIQQEEKDKFRNELLEKDKELQKAKNLITTLHKRLDCVDPLYPNPEPVGLSQAFFNRLKIFARKGIPFKTAYEEALADLTENEKRALVLRGAIRKGTYEATPKTQSYYNYNRHRRHSAMESDD